MTVEFRPNDQSYITDGGSTVFADGSPMYGVSIFVENLPPRIRTTPFDTSRVGVRYVISVNMIVRPGEIQFLRMPRRIPNPPPEPVQCSIQYFEFRNGLEVEVVHRGKDYRGRIFPT